MTYFSIAAVVTFTIFACKPQGGEEVRIKKSAGAHAHEDHDHDAKLEGDATAALPDCEKKASIELTSEDHDHDEGHEDDHTTEAKTTDSSKTTKCKEAASTSNETTPVKQTPASAEKPDDHDEVGETHDEHEEGHD